MASELKAAEEVLGSQPSKQPWQIRTQAGKLSPPQAPGPPVPCGLRSTPPVGCWGFPLSSQLNLSGIWQLDAPDTTSKSLEKTSLNLQAGCPALHRWALRWVWACHLPWDGSSQVKFTATLPITKPFHVLGSVPSSMQILPHAPSTQKGVTNAQKWR